ncbi:MAG: SPOR domain-containing protein [Bacteroidetes bacterium]|nr:SPOR domain-containing protein [Bacteroidota bacterium]
MNNRLIHITAALLLAVSALSAQLSEQEVRRRLDLIHSGGMDRVRAEVSGWLRTSPNDPGVLYLDAYTTQNGDQAVKKYQSLVDRFPDDVWADDALYKVYQYYYAVGLYKTADAKMNQLNQQYPNSIFSQNEAKPSEIGIQKAPALQPVQIVPAPEEKNESAAPVQAPVTGNFVVQVGVYSQESAAAAQAQSLTASVGRPAMVFQKQSGGKIVFAVAFDGFAEERLAKVFGAELKEKFNIDWYVVKR